jgi:hypothetical protein
MPRWIDVAKGRISGIMIAIERDRVSRVRHEGVGLDEPSERRTLILTASSGGVLLRVE